ncbi:unnamed protein product [Onchocerca ochengi]|uniref:SRP40_C domain-containing protein n=1 Tax=Onchocerca ochengi TaxID=42157 RepID=A0A182ECX0_ONCOC|nr:unnamed protein product [Onchocerca ochengi]
MVEDRFLNIDSEDYTRVREFNIDEKGTVVSRGDSFRLKSPTCYKRGTRNRSNLSNESTSSRSTFNDIMPGNNNEKDENNQPSTSTTFYEINVIGSTGVGKSTLIGQFMTSDHRNTYATDIEKVDNTVSIIIGDKESELTFHEIDLQNDNSWLDDKADIHLLIYSIDSKSSFKQVMDVVDCLRESKSSRHTPIVMAANKVDLERKRAVSKADAKNAAMTYGFAHYEVSVALNLDVDDLLVGLIAEIKQSLKSDSLDFVDNPSKESTDADSLEKRNDFKAAIRRFSKRRRQQMGSTTEKSNKMTESSPIDFDVLFYDHLIKEEPKLVNKVFSAQRRNELEKKRRSSGNFKPLKEVVKEYNEIICRKRGANGIINSSPAAKKALRLNEMDDSSDSSDSDHPIKQAAARIRRPLVPASSSNSSSDIPKKNKAAHPLNQSNGRISLSSSSSDSSSDSDDKGKISMRQLNLKRAEASHSDSLNATKKNAKITEISPPITETRKQMGKFNSYGSSCTSNEVTKKEIRVASTGRQAISEKADASTSSSSDDNDNDARRKIQQSIPEKSVPPTSIINLKNSAVPGSSSDSTSSSDDDDVGMTVKKSTLEKTIPAALSTILKNGVVAKKPSENSSDSTSSSDDDADKSLRPTLQGKIPEKKVSATPNANLKNAVSVSRVSESSTDSTSSNDDDVNKNLRPLVLVKVPGKVIPAKPNVNLKNAVSASKTSESSSDITSSSDDDANKSLKSSMQRKISEKKVSSIPNANLKNSVSVSKAPESSSDSTSSNDDDVSKNLRPSMQVKVPEKVVPAKRNGNLKNAISANKTSESSSDITSSSDDGANKSLKAAVQGKISEKTVSATPNANLKNTVPVSKAFESSSDSTSSSDDDKNNLKSAVQSEVSKKAVSVMSNANLKNVVSARKASETSDSTSSSDDDANMNLKSTVQGKVPKKAVPVKSNTKLKNTASAKKSSESSADSTSSNDDDENKNLMSVQGKVSRKVVPAKSNDNLKNAISASKTFESSSDSTSSSDDDADENLNLSVKQSMKKSLALQKDEKFKKSGECLDEKAPKMLTKTPGITASSVKTSQIMEDSDDSSSDSEKEIDETPAKKFKLQVQQKATEIVQKKALNTSSSDSSDSDSINTIKLTTNTQQKPVSIVNGTIKSSSSSSDSDQSGRRGTMKKTLTTAATKVVGNRTFANEDTASSDSNSNNDKMKKVQLAAAMSVKRSKKALQPGSTQSKTRSSSSSDSSSDSETGVLPERAAQKKQSVRLQNQQKLSGKQKLVDDSSSDDSSSDDTGGDNKTPNKKADDSSKSSSSLNKAVTISPTHLHQKLLNSSKLRVEKDSETSSNSNLDEAAMKQLPQITTGIKMNIKPVAIKGSATSSDSSDSSSDSDRVTKKRNVKAISKQANNEASKHDRDFTKQATMKQRELISVVESDEMDSDSSNDSSKSNTEDLAATRMGNSLGMAKVSNFSSSQNNNGDSKKRKTDSNTGKAANTMKAVASKEEKNKENQSLENINLKKEDKNTDLKEVDDNEQKRMGSNQNSVGKRNNKQQKVVQNEPFRRVKISKDELDDKFRDNSYRTKTYDQWGRKAYEDMKNVQGKGFRHEKTKKKRGSYGGSGTKIDTSSHSIKFSSDSD